MSEDSVIIEPPLPIESGIEMSYMELLTGPLSALALAIIMIVTIGRWLAKFVPTVVAKYMEQTDKTIEQLDKMNTSMKEHSDRCNLQTEAIIEKVRSTSAGLHNRLNALEPIIIKIEANQQKNAPE